MSMSNTKVNIQPMKTQFHVGQKVWDDVIFPGIEGTIESIMMSDSSAKAAIKVKVSESRFYSYALNGSYWFNYKPTLSAVPYTFTLPEQPETFERGEMVLMRMHLDSLWHACIYGKRFNQVHEDINGHTYYHCRKYDESLIGKSTE